MVPTIKKNIFSNLNYDSCVIKAVSVLWIDINRLINSFLMMFGTIEWRSIKGRKSIIFK